MNAKSISVKRLLRLLSFVLAFLSFLVLFHQRHFTCVKSWFQIRDVMHHETVALGFLALSIYFMTLSFLIKR